MNDDGSKEGAGSFKVLDKRRFDSGGNERPDVPPQSEAAPTPARERPREPQAAPKPAERSAPSENLGASSEPQHDDGQVTLFSSFVMSIASQALMFLGEMEPYPGSGITKNMQAARDQIDVLEMLNKKTKGNLDPTEAELLERILHSVRLSFVKVAKQGK